MIRRPARRPFRRPAPRGAAGFSLVEVLFALTILSIGLMALAGLIPFSTSKVSSSRSLTNASTAGEARLEDLKAGGYNGADLAAGTHHDTQGRYTRTWVVQDNVPVTGSKRIDLTVSWTSGHGAQSLRMSTFVTR